MVRFLGLIKYLLIYNSLPKLNDTLYLYHHHVFSNLKNNYHLKKSYLVILNNSKKNITKIIEIF